MFSKWRKCPTLTFGLLWWLKGHVNCHVRQLISWGFSMYRGCVKCSTSSPTAQNKPVKYILLSHFINTWGKLRLQEIKFLTQVLQSLNDQVYACVLSCFSRVWLFATPWTIDSSVHGVLQARILEWVAMPASRGSFQPRDQTHVSYVSCIVRQVLCH